MTLDECRANIGRAVVYTTLAMRNGDQPLWPEDGIINAVGEQYVFVQYRGQTKATSPEDLTLNKWNGEY